MYDVPELEINFDDWYKASVCLCSISKKMRSNVLNSQRTPLSSLTFTISSSNDCGIYTVFSLFFFFFFAYSTKNEHCPEQLQKLFDKKH